MPDIDINAPGKTLMLMGNEAIARGALEAGVGFAAAYPGTPSTEILPTLAGVAGRRNLYAEWSINEIVAFMNAAAAACAGIRSMAMMKQNGTNVAMDMLANQVNRGLRGAAGMVLVNVDDPGGRNSPNEQDTRSVAKMLDVPMLEPGTFQEAKDMIPGCMTFPKSWISRSCCGRLPKSPTPGAMSPWGSFPRESRRRILILFPVFQPFRQRCRWWT